MQHNYSRVSRYRDPLPLKTINEKFYIFALTLAMVAVSCQKEVIIDGNSVEPTTKE